MPWGARSARRAPLPPNWPQLVAATRSRAGGRCEQHDRAGRRCPNRGTDCHHAGDRTDHRPEALRWLCGPCHQLITAQQARAARRTQKRLVEPPPGLL